MGEHYEKLASLYLRLNGFVSSNLIIHSDQHGNEKSELDYVAFRMPQHNQSDRNEPTSPFLDLPTDRVQIFLGDSKSTTDPNKVRFNDGLRKDRDSIKKLIEWIGIFDKIDEGLIDKFEHLLAQKISNEIDGFSRLDFDMDFGKFQITFLFFCPLLKEPSKNQLKYIYGEEMLNYCFRCLNEVYEPEECNRTYGLKHWGELRPYVTYFKKINEPGSIDDFKAEFNT